MNSGRPYARVNKLSCFIGEGLNPTARPSNFEGPLTSSSPAIATARPSIKGTRRLTKILQQTNRNESSPMETSEEGGIRALMRCFMMQCDA